MNTKINSRSSHCGLITVLIVFASCLVCRTIRGEDNPDSHLQLEPTDPSSAFSGGQLVVKGADQFAVSDLTGFLPVEFHAGRGRPFGNYDHWHEAYFVSNGAAYLLNIKNTNNDGEAAIRFWKGDHQNQWMILIPSQPGYKLAIIRDALIDAMVFDEDGRVIIGRLPPNDYGPPQGRLHVRGMADERQLVVESSTDQTHPIVEITSHGAKQSHFLVNADGKIGIGTVKPLATLDVVGSLYVHSKTLQTDAAHHQAENIDRHAATMEQLGRLPALPEPQLDEQGREVVDLVSRQRALETELKTAHLYIAQLNKQLQQLQTEVRQLETANRPRD